MITLDAQLTEKDYLRANYLHLGLRLTIYGCVALVATVLSVARGWGQETGGNPILIGAAVGFTVYTVVGYGIMLPRRVKTVFRQQKNLQVPYKMTIGEDGVQSESVYGTSTYPWTDYHKCKIGKELVLLYQSDLMFHIFPKRWFAPEDFERFKSLAQSRIAPKK